MAIPLDVVFAGLFVVLGGDLFGDATPYVWAGASVIVTVVLVRLGTRIGKLFTSFFEMLSGI